MPLTLSSQDWDELWNADPNKRETTEWPDRFEVAQTWAGSLAQGRCRSLTLRDVWLTIEESQLREDIIFHAEPASWEPSSSFFVAGTMKSHHQGFIAENIESPGGHYLECLQSAQECVGLYTHFWRSPTLLSGDFPLMQLSVV